MIDVRKTKAIKNAITAQPTRVVEIIEAETELGICITNDKGFYVAVNERYSKIYGYSHNELIGKHFTTVVPPENHEKLQFMHDKFIENEYEILRNWVVMRKDRSLIKIQADAAFFNQIFDKTAHKLTFVNFEGNIE